jgi:AraC family transcriptional regulator
MKLYIKNMVCPRCITSVEQILKRNHLQAKYVRLGEVELVKKPAARQIEIFTKELLETGFELSEDAIN